MTQIPTTMRAVALDRFGAADVLRVQTLPVPTIAPTEVLMRVETAGVGEWDPFEREGGYAEMLGLEPDFPYVLGSEGAGSVVAVGDEVQNFKVGDRVYAAGFLNPKGGFYAEYAAVDAQVVSLIPDTLTVEQAGVMSGVGITALRGLDDTLKLKPGETVLIVGASGGVGHMAVQLAKRMGARVLAIASGEDGVALAQQLGSDKSINGRKDDITESVRTFAPDGLDAVLLTAGGEAAEQSLQGLRSGGRVAYPKGIQPEPQERPGIHISGYYGAPDADVIQRLNQLIDKAGSFTVHIAQTFPLERAADAHLALNEHYLGKLALRISD